MRDGQPEIEEPPLPVTSYQKALANSVMLNDESDPADEPKQLRAALDSVVSDYNELQEKYEDVLRKFHATNIRLADLLLSMGENEEPEEGKRAL